MSWLFKIDFLIHACIFLWAIAYGVAPPLFALLTISYLLLRYHSIVKSIAALSSYLAIPFRWFFLITWRCTTSFILILTPERTKLKTIPITDLGAQIDTIFRIMGHARHRDVALALLVSYALLWAPMAATLATCHTGLLSISSILLAPFSLFGKAVEQVRKHATIANVGLHVGAASTAGALIFFVAYLLSSLRGLPLHLLVGVTLLFVISTIGYVVGKPAILLWRDRLRWKAIRRPSKTPLSGSAFVETWLSFETQLFRTKYIRYVRDGSLLILGDQTTYELEKAIESLKAIPKQKSRYKNLGSRYGLLFEDPLLTLEDQDSDSPLPDLLDELFIMLERFQDIEPKGQSAKSATTSL